jgi:predicted nucleic acid-binding protein
VSALVDTSIWSLALRRRTRQALTEPEQELVAAWAALLRENRAVIIGPIRQEILTGVREAKQFRQLQLRLEAIPNTPIEDQDHIQAALFYSRCRAKGVAGTAIDLLICAVAARLALPVFTTDKDFVRYAKLLPIRLYPHPRR